MEIILNQGMLFAVEAVKLVAREVEEGRELIAINFLHYEEDDETGRNGISGSYRVANSLSPWVVYRLSDAQLPGHGGR